MFLGKTSWCAHRDGRGYLKSICKWVNEMQKDELAFYSDQRFFGAPEGRVHNGGTLRIINNLCEVRTGERANGQLVSESGRSREPQITVWRP
eukprot:Gb_09781 [translate_table: standard]